MEYNKRDTWLSAAFAVVKQYDPETYARMDRAEWFVTTDALDAVHSLPREQINGTLIDAARELAHAQAYGNTFPDAGSTAAKVAVSFIRRDAIVDEAHSMDVHSAMFAADVLVHEFRHIHEASENALKAEPPAFEAGSAFATKLPAPDGPIIRDLSEATESQVKISAMLGMYS